jgi:hypothetical protein
MLNVSFWESLRQGFLQLRAECAMNPPANSAGRLMALWTERPDAKRWELWLYDKKDTNGVAKRFEWYAESATARQAFGGTPDEARSSWLQQLTELDAFVHVTKQGSGSIDDVCLASAEYCRKCDANEMTAVTRRVKEPATAGHSLHSEPHTPTSPPEDGACKGRAGRKGDPALLGDTNAVNFKIAEEYLGIRERQRQKLIKSGALIVQGGGANKKITTQSLKEYLPPETPH